MICIVLSDLKLCLISLSLWLVKIFIFNTLLTAFVIAEALGEPVLKIFHAKEILRIMDKRKKQLLHK